MNTTNEKRCVLKIRDLSVSFQTQAGVVNAVRNVNLDLNKGETVAIVGESGCGKSVTVKAVMGILSSNQIINSGTIDFSYMSDGKEKNVDLAKMSQSDMEKHIKGKRIAMVFQDPMTSLDPTMTIGKQIIEGPMLHENITKAEAWKRAVDLLGKVGIENPEKRMKQYPHQLSGGMRQRVVIAIALACNPELLICDEPTTALDVTIQARILQLILDIQKRTGISVIFITHDLGVVAKVADHVNVMYAGKIVETGTVNDIFYDPRHPYTWGLLASMPDVNTSDKRLATIPGNPPNLLYPIKGDAFAPRNKYALNIDFEEEPPMFTVNEHHKAATWLLHPDAPKMLMPTELKQKIDRLLKEVK